MILKPFFCIITKLSDNKKEVYAWVFCFAEAEDWWAFALGLILVVYLFNAISSINQDESETLIMFSQLQIRLLEFGGFMFIVWLALSFASLYFALEGVAPIMLVNVFCLIIWVVWVVIIVSVYQSAMQVSFEIALPQSLQGFLSLTVAFGIPMFNGFEIMYSLME